MKRFFSPVAIVGLVLTAVCCAIYISNFGAATRQSALLYDVFLRQIQKPPQSDRVVIVDIDDRSLSAVGQWPWPRYLVARMTERILDGDPAAVAFDVVFPEKDRTSPAMIRGDIKAHLGLDITFQGLPDEYADYDAAFAKVLRHGKAILGCAMEPSPDDDPLAEADPAVDPLFDASHILAKGPRGVEVAPALKQARDVTVSHDALREASLTAFFNADADQDSIVRSNPLIWAYGPNRVYPALSLEAIRVALGIDQCIVRYDKLGVVDIRLKDLVIPCSRKGRLVINYRTVKTDVLSGFSSSFPTFSAVDILGGKVPAASLAGKIVFVGTSAVGLRDIKATPITDLFSGVEVHANMVDNILTGDALWRPNYVEGIEFVGLLLSGLLLTVLVSKGRALTSLLFTILAVVAIVSIPYLLISHYHLVVMPTWMLFSVMLIYTVLTAMRYWQEERQKDRVRKMFGTMVSRDVLRYLENNPESFSLTGAKVEATIFFSDVAGFTSFSEQLPPERLSSLLNRYLTPMTDIVMTRGGYVDKYEGDCIMAEWGVPFAMKDHAVQGCLAALEQQEKLAEIRPVLRAEFGHEIHVRMGINSGLVTAGNMGSKNRFSYTVMGDVVNFASRCEPANKDYGTLIIIGDRTRQLAAEAIEARLLDRIVVKGKTVPVQIHELLGRKGQMSDTVTTTVCLYQEALHLHWDRRWDEAIARLDEALRVLPSDTPSQRLRDRIMAYKAAPPPESWNGEHVRAHKD
jgi:adenylate cyclase